MSETENNDLNAEYSTNKDFVGSNALQLRLDTEPLLQRLEMDIRGIREVYNPETQKIELFTVANPLFKNEMGVQVYLSHVRSVVNSQVVQGNLDEDSYGDYMYAVHEGLAYDLMVNRFKYGLELYHYRTVITMAMNTIRGFLTRPINDRERGSYAATMKHSESNQIVSGKSGGFFNFKN